MLRLYKTRLADLEYKEGLGSVHAPLLRRCIAVLESVCNSPPTKSSLRKTSIDAKTFRKLN